MNMEPGTIMQGPGWSHGVVLEDGAIQRITPLVFGRLARIPIETRLAELPAILAEAANVPDQTDGFVSSPSAIDWSPRQ